jgi:CubicO group peptidase (beta-lactamase class C family)
MSTFSAAVPDPSSPIEGHEAPANFVDGLERASPSDVGIDSDALLAFLEDMENSGLEIHSIMLHRHGKVAAEAWRWPYRADRPRILHSTAKSFAACAIGLAIEEGHFKLTDKVVSFFPNELPPVVSEKLAAMTVEDLLTMRTGQESETSGSIWRGINTSWIVEFFKIPLVHQPGSTYVYTSAASYMLSAILTRVTGETLHDYLKPRLLRPLGIVDETWDLGPDGINPGGNGLTAKTVDMLKLGILHQQGGMWEGKRLLPEAWVNAATRPQGQQADSKYGYHWAIRPKEAFSAIGVFMQAVTVYRAHGASFALTGAIDGSAKMFPYYEKHFPKPFLDKPLPNPQADARLKAKLEAWAQPRTLPKPVASPLPAKISGKVFDIERNAAGVTQIQFDFVDGRCIVKLTDAEGQHQLTAGVDCWIEGRTDMPGRDLHHGYRLRNAKVVTAAFWTDERTLEMSWIFVETAFRDKVVCQFDGDRLTFKRGVNINSGLRQHPDLFGIAKR